MTQKNLEFIYSRINAETGTEIPKKQLIEVIIIFLQAAKMTIPAKKIILHIAINTVISFLSEIKNVVEKK